MPFTLDEVVPWGRSLAEYQRMFDLTPRDFKRRILGCADGPASFNAEATGRGASVTSVDPLYVFSREEIQRHIETTYPVIVEQARRNQSEFLWTHFRNVDELGRARMASMLLFLDDYDRGRADARYLAAQLPSLPFPDHAFDLALCSHFLFLYSGQFNFDFHLASILELCRVAVEVRIYPLVELGSIPSRHVSPVIDALRARGLIASLEPVDYEFQRGATHMLLVVADQ